MTRRRQPESGPMDRLGFLYATMHPIGLWTEPCIVTCPCGFEQKTENCLAAQRLCLHHDQEHWRKARKDPT